MDPTVSRTMWRLLEPYHAMVFFAPEANEIAEGLGLDVGWMSTFAYRSAAFGTASAALVTATFYNFNPEVVAAAIPEAWNRATPEAVLAGRLDAADGALRRLLGDRVEAPEVREAAELTAEAMAACPVHGRPLFAAHSSLPWPESPHLALWHAAGLFREFRGDGHVAALLVSGLTPVQALVLHGASGESSPKGLKITRAWPDETWAEAEDDLHRRGWLSDGALTDDGAGVRASFERTTDELALAPWVALGEDRCARLRDLVRPLGQAIIDAGGLGFLSKRWPPLDQV